MKKDTIIWILIVWVVALGALVYALATSPSEIKVISISATPTPVPTYKEESAPTQVATATPSPSPTPTPSPTLAPTSSPTPTPTSEPTPTLEAITGQTEFKSYERYTAITRKTSDQYKLQQVAYTGDYGIRMVEGRYCVALGSRWSTTIGEKLDVIMQDGTIIPVILGDCKQDRHTDPTNTWGLDNGDILEFIVDENEIPATVRICGSFNEIFKGKVADIRKAE